MEGLTIMELQQAGYVKTDGHVYASMHRLKQQFPSAGDDVIKDVLRG